MEYLAFPEKFDFFDIDLQPALAGCPAGTRRLVLHVILPELTTARLLQSLPSTMLRSRCTPVTSTNGNLPSCLPIGRPGGDLAGDGIPPRYPMRFLRRPTASRLPTEVHDSPWKLSAVGCRRRGAGGRRFGPGWPVRPCHRRNDGFTRLVVLNTKGEERVRCEARAGGALPV